MTNRAPAALPVRAILRGGLVYFACVFGAGFVLGPLRVLFLVPRVGARTAELLEMPVMLLVIVFAARWLHARRWRALDRTARAWLGVFTVACALGADVLVGIGLRGMTLREVFLERDPVSGAAYYGLLALCGALPWLLAAGRMPQAIIRAHTSSDAPGTRSTASPATDTHASEDTPRR